MTDDPRRRWKLKRTRQCAKCPWLVGVDPHQIPNGYTEEKHRALEKTIARDPLGSLAMTDVMACHEMHDAHCIGWVVNQIGPGNNIGLRLQMRHCDDRRASGRDCDCCCKTKNRRELMAKRKMLVDPACAELADHFLKDVNGHVTDEDRTEFAEAIQRICEDFVSAWDQADRNSL